MDRNGIPLLAVVSAISAIAMIGGLIAMAESPDPLGRYCGIAAVFLAAIVAAGGFALAERMLARTRRRDRS